MSSVHRQQKRPHWFCAYTSPDGQRHFRSTGTTDKKTARKICALWEQAADQARVGKLTMDKARALIARGVADLVAASGDELPSVTISGFLKSWLARKELEAGEKTHTRYSTVVEQFNRFMGPKSARDLAQLTSKDLTAFRDFLSARVSTGTTNISIKILRSALNQAKRDGLIDMNEGERVTLLKSSRVFERRAFTVLEIKRILAAADPEWRGIVLCALYTGLRLTDVVTLTWANISLVQKELIVTTAKTGRRQILPLAKPLLLHLESLPAGDNPSAPLFPSAHAARQRSRYGGTLSNQFHKILVAAKLADKRTHQSRGKGRGAKREVGGLSFHCLRHSATTWLKNSGCSDAIAMDIIGHDSPAISANYSHISSDAKRAALDQMPDVTQ